MNRRDKGDDVQEPAAENVNGGEIPPRRSALYAGYVLVMLVVANILNYADRSILGVLAQPIKRDLGISDAELGFLYGTSFVVLNTVMGLAAAKLCDVWLRHRLLALGLALWSGMTALSGLATSYVQLAAARVGVGVGEATISPVGHGVIADLFPPHRRGFFYAIYFLGPFVGGGLCLGIGGWLVDHWAVQCGALGLCGVKGWQAAFLAFGLPGLLLALLILPMGEVAHGEELARRKRSRPLVEGLSELTTVVPPFTLWQLATLGGARSVTINLVAALGIALLAALLIHATGDTVQWAAVGLAGYCVVSWVQALAYRDPALYRLTVISPAFASAAIGMGTLGAISGSLSFWTVPLAVRTFGVSAGEAGAKLGIAIALGSVAGMFIGGVAADRLRVRSPAGPLWLGIASVIGSGLLLIVLLEMKDITSYALVLAVLMAVSVVWNTGTASLVQEMILPSMRGRGAAMFAMTVALIALSLGPYTVGRVSDLTGSIGIGIGALFLAAPVSIWLLVRAARNLPEALARKAEMHPAVGAG